MAEAREPSISPAWFKSSYSGGNTTECVETAFVVDHVLVRDSKAPDSLQIRVSKRAWRGFVAAPPHIRLPGSPVAAF